MGYPTNYQMKHAQIKRGRSITLGLTPAQVRRHQVIAELLEKMQNHRAVQEIASSLNLAPPTVHAHLQKLDKNGHLALTAGQERSLLNLRSSVTTPKVLSMVPIVGKMCLGSLACERKSDRREFNRNKTGKPGGMVCLKSNG